jgi:NAD(P)-dependent dehydrogenase (short-subunit alcohol dehydrogenase family)
MEIKGRSVLILGGSGLVGMAVARELMQFEPGLLIISGLTKAEAETGVAEMRSDPALREGTKLVAEWGDIFVSESLKDRPRGEVLADSEARVSLLDDLLGELTDEVVTRSTFGALLDRHKPEIIVDCVNTATAFAYQNIFRSAADLRAAAKEGKADTEAVERHLATLYLPQLIRHVQIALDAMHRNNTGFYLKVGTAGTGGMGLNIPFTHSEERPSRMLLAKSSLAGAHSLLLYLMARTPGGPAVKEIKPTAAISWKRIGFGPIQKRGKPIAAFDATKPLPLETAFRKDESAYVETGRQLDGVFLDAGENGWFSLGEFETLTALGLMEFITPEEIAVDVVREIRGYATGHDIVAALDSATSGPTYRAGVLREAALDRMESLERQHGVRAVAYEMLGPPRLSKLLFEAEILSRLHSDLRVAAALDPDDTAARAHALLKDDADLRVRMISIGIPILLPDGQTLLRGPDVKVGPDAGQSPADARLADNGWVDLRASNWRTWKERAAALAKDLDLPLADSGSRADVDPEHRRAGIRPGRLAAWVFRYEDKGERIKR